MGDDPAGEVSSIKGMTKDWPLLPEADASGFGGYYLVPVQWLNEMKSLVKGVEVDLDQPLSEDDE